MSAFRLSSGPNTPSCLRYFCAVWNRSRRSTRSPSLVYVYTFMPFSSLLLVTWLSPIGERRSCAPTSFSHLYQGVARRVESLPKDWRLASLLFEKTGLPVIKGAQFILLELEGLWSAVSIVACAHRYLLLSAVSAVRAAGAINRPFILRKLIT